MSSFHLRNCVPASHCYSSPEPHCGGGGGTGPTGRLLRESAKSPRKPGLGISSCAITAGRGKADNFVSPTYMRMYMRPGEWADLCCADREVGTWRRELSSSKHVSRLGPRGTHSGSKASFRHVQPYDLEQVIWSPEASAPSAQRRCGDRKP